MKKTLSFLLLFLFLFTFSAPCEEAAFTLTSSVTEGLGGSLVCCPVLEGSDAAVCDRVNARIREKARIDSYISLLSSLSAGSTGLKVNFDSNVPLNTACPGILSLVIRADGKMLKGRPGTVYYTLTFDLSSGDEISFNCLCSDADTARSAVESLIEERVTPEISDYMSASRLLPVPFDSFFLDGRGNIVFYYDKTDFSFISGAPGAAALKLSSLQGMDQIFLEKAAVPDQPDIALDCLGKELDEVLAALSAPFDSSWFPGGEAWQVEAPLYRGTSLISEDGQTVTKLMCREFVPCGTALSPEELPADALKRDLDPDEQELAETAQGLSARYEKDGIIYTCLYDANGSFLLVLCERAR